jgi:uncharacterized protein YegL
MNLLDLSKSLELNLAKAEIFNVPVMAVKLLVDKSGSMDAEYRTGWVQNTIDLFLAAAMKFDDDGVLQIGFFNTSFDQTQDVTEADAGSYIKRNGIYPHGGTSFAGGIQAFKGASGTTKPGLFGKLMGKKEVSNTPVYLAMITDGENNDKAAFERELAQLDNTFVQIVGIGLGVDKNYLDKVAKNYNNVSVIYLDNPQNVTPDEFYEKLLNTDLKAFIKE